MSSATRAFLAQAMEDYLNQSFPEERAYAEASHR